jgi:hypothetical protein
MVRIFNLIVSQAAQQSIFSPTDADFEQQSLQMETIGHILIRLLARLY